MSRVLVVALGGALGAIARYGVSLAVAAFWRREFPLATFLINVTGCFILGYFATLAAQRMAVDPLWRLFIATGFVGAYTTFSTFEYETFRSFQDGELLMAGLNVALSVAIGFVFVWLGVITGRSIS